MRDGLLSYYERELGYLREQGTAFARRYPKVASRLELNPSQCEDPHVERLLEGFAFLAARVHLRLDDEYPEIAQALLSVVCPHLLRPLPSMSVARLSAGGGSGEVTAAVECPRGQMLAAQLPGGGSCQFQSAADAVVQPLRVAAAHWTSPDQLPASLRVPGAARAMRLRLECTEGALIGDVRLSPLRFFVNGTASLAYSLHEALLNRCLRVHARPVGPESAPLPWLALGPDALSPRGLEPEEAILPAERRAFSGYQILREYFAYPEKHLFVDLDGLAPLAAHGSTKAIEIVFSFHPGEPTGWDHAIAAGLSPDTLPLDCAPVVNLFPVTADPIPLDAARYDYPLVPDLRQRASVQVYSIEQVLGDDPRGGTVREFSPFHSHKHRYAGEPEDSKLYWNAVRRAPAADQGAYWMSFHDLSGRKRLPDASSITVRCLCTNGGLPHRFSSGGDGVELTPLSTGPIRSARLLRKPTPYVEPPLDGGMLWKLVSHLSLNALSLASGAEPMRELLRLYAPLSADAGRQIAGIASIECTRHFSRVASEEGIAFARGIGVDLRLDEEAFAGASAFLFAGVMERFLASYVSVNAFSRLTARTLQRKEVLRAWPARTGSTILL